MNLFYLDKDLTKCAQYHIDRHVGKMQLEATQLLTSALWVDKLLGYVPRKLEKEELGLINEHKRMEPDIDDRKFTRYLPTHLNHPCAIWVRSSLDNYLWTKEYIIALNEETQWRGNKSHASCKEALRLPPPTELPARGYMPHALAMPDEYKTDNLVQSYRNYYINEKADIASWKKRGAPEWWPCGD